MQLHSKQKEVIQNPARFKVIRAGRKAGKSAMEVEDICYKAIASASKLNLAKSNFITGRKVLYIAPTQAQARNIIWEALKTRLYRVGKPNEQMLQMKVPNEDGKVSTIYVGGWENRENYRGLTDVVHITFDEVDTLRDFFISWMEIFRPMFLDTAGTANFIGTPKKENPNMRRLEKDFSEKGDQFATFHFTSKDNPFIPESELLALEEEYKDDRESYEQEILAKYVDNNFSLFRYDSILDVFENTVDTTGKYLTVDVADEGGDKSIFSYWNGLEEYDREEFEHLNTEAIISQIRQEAGERKIPYSNIAIDAIGVGAGVASSSYLSGVIGFKSSFSPIKTDINIVQLPNVKYLKSPFAPLTSDYKNLRSQCVFALADYVNNHKIASRVIGRQREVIIEELQCYQDASVGDGKRMATQKDDIKKIIGRSPDATDTWIMRMYFELARKMIPGRSENDSSTSEKQKWKFFRNKDNQHQNSSK